MENDMAISKIKLKIGTVYQKEPNGIYYFRYQVNGTLPFKRKYVGHGIRYRNTDIIRFILSDDADKNISSENN